MPLNYLFACDTYYQILNKSIIRNKGFHFIINFFDISLLLIKILDVYQAKYNNIANSPIKFLNVFSNFSMINKIILLIIYLVMSYAIYTIYNLLDATKKLNKFDIIIINFGEFFLIRLLISFYFDILFSFHSLYFLLFLILSIPFFVLIFRNLTFFHLTGFMLKIIVFPFDDFTSLCDRQQLIIKIIISICFINDDYFISKYMFFVQFILSLIFLLYDTYIIFYKSYYMMNNEFISKTKYSHLLSMVGSQILMIFLNPEEVLKIPFLIIIFVIMFMPSIFMFLFYNPYNYIIIDYPENMENAFYYLFLVDRNKNVTFFLEEKIKEHIYKCDYCQLCANYHELKENNIIEFDKDKDDNGQNFREDLFNIIYDGKDKTMILYNHITKNVNKLGSNCLYNNYSYYIINLIYIYYYTFKMGNFALSLNQLLLFNLIQENNKILILNHKLSIKQITTINDFFVLYKRILLIIKKIISKINLKTYIHKFFELSKQLTLLNSSKFKDNLYATKSEGVTNCSYLLNICSLLYEEIFNKTLSSYSIPIRENTQLHEDILKQHFRQKNNITLNLNLKTIECKIINAGKELFYYINTNFYDLFPNQFKEALIHNFSDIILNSKDNSSKLACKNNLKHNKKIYIEPTLLIKISVNNVKYHRLLQLKLALLFNDHLNKNILLSGFFHINENILVTIKTKGKKETIAGFGNKDIMEEIYKAKFNLNLFKKSEFMKNKLFQYGHTLSMNTIEAIIYYITEIKKKQKKIIFKNQIFSSALELNRESSIKENYNIYLSNIADSEIGDDSNSHDISHNENNNSISDNQHNINNLLEETASQSSVATTRKSNNSFWNINKILPIDDQNNFASKKFLNLQLLLGGLLITLLILMVVLIIQLRVLKNDLSQYYNNYFDLHQFVRTFQQFSSAFMSVVCIVKDDYGNCGRYLSSLDTEEFNQTLFIMEQNAILVESCSNYISKMIKNSETIQDNLLIGLFKGNIFYHIVSSKKTNKIYYFTYSEISSPFSEALILLSNNMRIIISSESKVKTRDKEPIFLISGTENPFQNVKNNSEVISDFQIAIYTFLINYRLFVVRFSDISSRLNELIKIKNLKILKILNIFHNINFLVMIFQIITIIFYLLTYFEILVQIINSIILKFDLIFDDENDFKKLFAAKIDQLESIVSIYSNNPITSMNEINKNSIKYKNLINKKKKNEQNINKKIFEEDKAFKFNNRQKYINWKEIYKKGYGKFYMIFTLIIAIGDILVYGIILIIWIEYSEKSKATFEIINHSWIFERNTLRVANFFNTMIFMNLTSEDISHDYFSPTEDRTMENLLQILSSYYVLRKKRQKIINIYKRFSYFSDYNCKSLYNVIQSIEDNSFAQTLLILKDKYNLDPERIKNGFIKECEESKPFIGNSVSPSFQSLYQKIANSMILLNNRTYKAIIDKIFNSNFPKISSLFLSVTRYIIYIVGKVTYTDASNRIIEILGNYIDITLILYIISEILLFIIFFLIYIWNINTECKNMFKLKSVFEITNSIEN